MPKKSKRRAKASGGGGGGGKARGSGGQEPANVAAKNSDANNGGILTAGAIQMLLKRDANKEYWFPKKHAPILQIVGDVELQNASDALEDGFTLCLSDGEHCVWAIASRRIDRESYNFLANGQLTGNSIIRLRRTFFAYSAAQGCDVVAICKAAIVETKVDGMIGSPRFFASDPVGSPCSEEAEATVDDAPPPPDGRVSYSERLKLAREVLAWSGNAASKGNLKLIAKHCCDALNLPRNLTEGFRSTFIMDYCALAEQTFADLVPDTSNCNINVLGDYLDCVEGYTQLFRSIASDMTESVDTRAMAVYACCLPSCMFTCATTNHMNYLRRFIVMSKEVCLHDLPAPFDIVIDKSSGIGKFRIIDSVKMFLNFLKIANLRLQQFGGLATLEVSDHIYTNPRTAHFCRTFGGFLCDNCGKSSNDVGMNHLFKCKSCRLSWYCSESCQAECWSKGHRDCCKKFGSFRDGDILVLFGLKKKYDLNLTIVQLLGSDSSGRLKVMIVVPGTHGLRQTMGIVSGGRLKEKNLVQRSTAYSAGMVISVKKENLRHCRPLQ